MTLHTLQQDQQEHHFEPATFEKILHDQSIKNLTIIVNPRMKRSWNVRINSRNNTRTLSIPLYLKDAPVDIKKALIDWSLLPQTSARTKGALIVTVKHGLEKAIQQYITTFHASHSQPRFKESLYKSELTGIKYNLQDIFDSVNREYFNSELQALLRWGSPSSGTSYQMTRKRANGDTVNVITIAGCYDHEDIPRFALEAVMYHEMLHIKIPPRKVNGRNCIHGPDFKKAEQQFTHFKEWRMWEKEHLRKILLRRKLSRKKSRF